MTRREILNRREALRTEMRGIVEAHPTELPEAVQTRWAALEAEAATLNAQEQRAAVLDELDRRAGGQQIAGSGDNQFDRLAAQVTALDTIRAQMGATDAGAGRAREVSAEFARRSGRSPSGLFFPMVERRSLNLSTGNGSALVQTDVATSVIDVLRAKSVVMKLGAQTLSGLVGNLALPRLASSASVSWVADGTNLTPSNPTIEQQLFQPRHCGGVVSLSRQLLIQSSPDVAAVVESDLAALIATAIDMAALAGTGGVQPTGILNLPGLAVVSGGANGAAITWQNVQALVGAIDQANALDGKLGFATNAKVAKQMRSTLRTPADSVSNFVLNDSGPLAGYPIVTTQNVPSTGSKGSGTGLSSMIFGDWSSLYIASWSMLDILVNPYSATSYLSGGVDVRAVATVDCGVRHVAAFAAITDIAAP